MHAKGIKAIVETKEGLAGVRFHMGQFAKLGLPWELWSVKQVGMSEWIALKTATILGARTLGMCILGIGSIEKL